MSLDDESELKTILRTIDKYLADLLFSDNIDEKNEIAQEARQEIAIKLRRL